MCNMNKELLYSYEDNSIEPLEKIILEEHLKYCNECSDELIGIRKAEEIVSTFDFEDINVPERLSLLKELVYDNCLKEMENEQSRINYDNYKESLRLIRSTLFTGCSYICNNPYDKFLKKNFNRSLKLATKVTKNYCRRKIEKSRFAQSKIYKILKAV